MSIQECFSKAGIHLLKRDREAIEALIADGMSEEEAVDTHLQSLTDEMSNIESQAQEQGVGTESLAQSQPVLFSPLGRFVDTMNIPAWKKEIIEGYGVKFEGMGDNQYVKTFYGDDAKKEAEEFLSNQMNVNWNIVEIKNTGRAKGNDVWAKIKSAPLKKAEVEFTGIEEFLTADSDAVFTRLDVQNFIEENGMNVEVVVADEFQEDNPYEIQWTEQKVWDDPEAWEWRIEDIVDDADSNGLVENAIEKLKEEESDYIDLNKDPDEDVEDYLKKEFNVEISDIVHELARDRAEEEYRDDPIYITESDYLSDGSELIIFGNDAQGYDVRTGMMYSDVVRSDIWSHSEAEIQANEYARENNLIVEEENENAVKWSEYVAPGVANNYREIKLTLPEMEEDFYHASHFDDRNIATFLRVDDRQQVVGDKTGEVVSTSIRIRHTPDMVVKRVVELIDDQTGNVIWGRGASEKSGTDEHIIEQVTERLKEPRDFENQYYVNDEGQLLRHKEIKTYAIQELQSDWASEIRRRGVSNNLNINEIHALEDKISDIKIQIMDDYNILSDHDFGILISIVKGESVNNSREEIKTLSENVKFREEAERYIKTRKTLTAERTGAPDMPFKGDAWISLGMKHAIMDAISNGYEAISWPNNKTIQEQWSERYDYSSQYDKKMVSIAKKLSGEKPTLMGHDNSPLPTEPGVDITGWTASPAANDSSYFLVMNAAGEIINEVGASNEQEAIAHAQSLEHDDRDQPGYWIIPITDKLKDKVEREGGMSMFQQDRGSIELTDNQRIIRLSKASDLSTFLHEAGHLFLEMEKVFASKYGITDNQKTILEFVGADSFDQITAKTPEGVEMHEKFARAFEAYLREGKAPSLKLRDAFTAFSRWLKQIYKTIMNLDVELNDEIRQTFDRMLATEVEIEDAMSNPAYDQFFKSAEQAGMTDAEFKKYKERVAKARNRAEGNLDETLIKELHKRRTAEWKEERQPLIDEAVERMSKQTVYQVLSDLKVEKMDYDLVVETYGRVPDKMIGKAKKGGIDPAVYAEEYGFDSAEQMLKIIDETPPLKKAAEEQAEAIMIDRHGDILNDGTIEAEAREAVHNDAQASLLVEELKILNRGTRKPDINREYLKAEARKLIKSMKFSEIVPSKFYRNEIKAAENAVKATDRNEQLQFKTQQLANHYLYREAVDTKERMTKQRRYVKSAQSRDYDTKVVDPAYVQNIKSLANLYDMRVKPEQALEIKRIIEWYTAQINDPNEFVRVELLDPHLVLALEAKERGDSYDSLKLPTFDDLIAEDLQGLYDMLRHLRYVGGKLGDQEKLQFAADKQSLRDGIISKGGRDAKGTRGTPRRFENRMRGLQHMINKLPSLRNMIRLLDNSFDKSTDTGVAYDMLYTEIENANSEKIRLSRELYERFKEQLSDIHTIGLDRRKSSEVTLTKSDGTDWTLASEHRFMLALYWGTESSREAIRDGHGVTDQDVMSMMGTLTPEQLRLVNATWKLNETMWPDLSAASVKVYGVAPPKLDPTPFTVNGVNMTGGHMRLIYDSQELELKTERDEAGMISTVMPTKAGSLHARVGSGGRPVLLDKNNITRSLSDSVHFVAFAEPGLRLAGMLNSKEVRAAIERKHGVGFYKALIETVDGVTSNRHDRESIPELAHVMRLVRKAATMKVLAYSIRNTVQQVSALPIAAQEVGTGALLKTYMEFATPEGYRNIIELANKNSEFMRDRASLVNREAQEYLRQVTVSGRAAHAWDMFSRYGFTPQTVMDAHIAYPTWVTRYRQQMIEHGDSKRAASAADTAVAESVGSGSNLHLGGAFSTNASELTKTLTMFGSWFNAYYNRMYRSTRGFTGVTGSTLPTLVTTPFVVAIMSALVVMDEPGDDEDPYLWGLKTYGGFMAGTIPIIRDFSGVFQGFTPKTPLGGAIEAPVKFVRELEAGSDGRQSAKKTVSDVTKAFTSVVPVPGAGNMTRTLDYLDSYEQGREGEFNAYQMLVEGTDK